MGSLSIWHWMIVIVVVMLLFGGRGKISELMGDFAQGIKAFKKGMSDDDKRGRGQARAGQDHRGRRRNAEDGNRAARRERALVNGAGGGVATGAAACADLSTGTPVERFGSCAGVELIHVRSWLGRARRHRHRRADRDRAEGAADRSAHARPVDGQGPPHGQRIPGPVPGSDARGRDRRPQEARRRYFKLGQRILQHRSAGRRAEGRRAAPSRRRQTAERDATRRCRPSRDADGAGAAAADRRAAARAAGRRRARRFRTPPSRRPPEKAGGGA